MKKFIIPLFRAITFPLFFILMWTAYIIIASNWIWEFKHSQENLDAMKEIEGFGFKKIYYYILNKDYESENNNDANR